MRGEWVLTEKYDIAGYCRISVDEEQDRENTSIENQKAIIEDYVREHFPESSLTFFEDRDRSGYTFEQREGYQTMRKGLLNHTYDILVVKDFSRFSRRNSKGLGELEDLRDADVRIISIGDGIDYPQDDQWLNIQLRFLMNEMPVTDASKKVRAVVNRRQKDGKWICAAPYGYRINFRKEFEVIPAEAEVIRRIYAMYIDGWGYQRIANYLTAEGIPTPRMSERDRKEAEGREYKRKVKSVWAIASVQTILENDFYIGTLRQSKFMRKKINGKDIRRDVADHIVIEDHHQAILEYRDFRIAQELRKARSGRGYRGVRKYDNTYSGFLVCGDCGSPMFSMSRPDPHNGYRCGAYHRRGIQACTSHHIRSDTLDALVKEYLRMVRDTSGEMLKRLQADLEKQDDNLDERESSAADLQEALDELMEELQVTRRQRMRDLRKHPEREERLNQSYDQLEDDLEQRIGNLQKQLEMTVDRKNTIVRVKRAAQTAMEVFDEVLEKEHLDARDIHLILDKIAVFEDHLEIRLKPDIDGILRCGTMPDGGEELRKDEETGDFSANGDLKVEIIQRTKNRSDKKLFVNVINDGDPLEIYTDKDGEVIFKKYSPMGELSEFAAQMCESLFKTTGCTVAVADRDTIIAAAGSGRRELMDKRISQELEQIMEERQIYQRTGASAETYVTDGPERLEVSIAAPILSEGDVMGCVVFVGGSLTETEYKLAQTTSAFLGKQMEN